MKLNKLFTLLALMALASPVCAGGFLVEVDIDGADDGPFTPSPNFSFGGNTTTASTSIVGTAVGLTGGDSLFGGDTVSGTTTPDPDTYVYTYTPASDADNFGPGAGTLLNSSGDVVTGLSGGSGTYAAYAAWPATTNVSNSPANFELSDTSGVIASTSVDQNGGDGAWVKLFEFPLDPAETYTLTQTNTQGFVAGVPGFSDDNYTNGFVSMRASGALFQAVPEPTSALLVLAGVAGLGFARRR